MCGYVSVCVCMCYCSGVNRQWMEINDYVTCFLDCFPLILCSINTGMVSNIDNMEPVSYVYTRVILKFRT